MQDLPHQYNVTANAEFDGNVPLKVDDVPQLVTAPPAEFGGPGDQWSPETLLVGAVLDSFIFMFRGISRASSLEWLNLDCSATGAMERVKRANCFTSFTIRATLIIPVDTDTGKAQRLLEKAQAACPITHSLRADTRLETEIIVES
ncbi:MAG: OsmC family protein [Gammaproteobacteria bacterium]|nr:OsmC family protein [Gammaproteobacteria bacterium]